MFPLVEQLLEESLAFFGFLSVNSHNNLNISLIIVVHLFLSLQLPVLTFQTWVEPWVAFVHLPL